MNRLKAFLAEQGIRLALCLLAGAMLLYAATYYEQPAPQRLELTASVTTVTQSATVTKATCASAAPCRDLNAAAAEDLMRIEGIGETTAERILAVREEQGGFRRRSDLLAIEGVGEILMERIMAAFYITDELPPVITETTTPAVTTTGITVTAGRYDLNLVTKEELMRIPDMTEALADGILELRTLIQYYTHLYEVLYVEGMDGVYVDDVLADHLYVTPQTATKPP